MSAQTSEFPPSEFPLRSRAARSRAKVLQAARDCFEKIGIEQTTIVDIAAQAEYSRPIIYKHFKNINDIIDAVCLEEMQQVVSELQGRINRDLPPHEEMAQAIEIAVQLAHRNQYIRRFMEDRESWIRSQRIGETVRDYIRGQWEPFIKRGRQAGAFATDISVEEAITWIAMNQSQLLIRFRNEAINQDWLHQFIRRFVVKPLLTDG